MSKFIIIIIFIFTFISCSTTKLAPSRELASNNAEQSCFELVTSIAQNSIHHAEQPVKETAESIQKLINDHIENYLKNFEENKIYEFKFRNSNVIIKGKYLGKKINENGIVTITILNLENNKIITDLRPFSIQDFIPVIEQVAVKKKLLSKVIASSLETEQFTKLIFKPYKIFSKRNSIEYAGSFNTNAELATKMIDAVEKFDLSMGQVGFTKVEMTRIIFNDKPTLPSLVGPFYMKAPVRNVFSFQKKSHIVMNPLMLNSELVFDESVLLHERAHSFLKRSYNQASFINSKMVFQEAFADYYSGAFLNTAVIGKRKNDNPIRDFTKIYTRLLGTSEVDPHGNGLYVSSLMWQIREKIGQEKSLEFSKNLIENLNIFYEPFVKSELLRYASVRTRKQLFLYDFEYFLAVLKYTLKDYKEDEAISYLNSTVLHGYGFDLNNVNKIMNNLTADTKKFHYDSNFQSTEVIQIYGSALKGFAVEAAIMYGVFETGAQAVDYLKNNP
jgi:hypothetical protein